MGGTIRMEIHDYYSKEYPGRIDLVEIHHGNIKLFLTKEDGTLLKRSYLFKQEQVTLKEVEVE